MFIIVGSIVALAFGIYVGLGMPGVKGRQDRVVVHGRPQRLQKKHIDWLKGGRR